MPTKQPAVYIISNRERATLYVGVTGWLRERVHEHREKLHDGFTKKYCLNRLVWFELHADFLLCRKKNLNKRGLRRLHSKRDFKIFDVGTND